MQNQYQSPYEAYAYLQRAQPQRQGQQDPRAQQMAQQVMGQPAQNVTQGVSQLATGIGMGLRDYMNKGFPQAPGGAQPSMMTGLANLFTGNRNGGLY